MREPARRPPFSSWSEEEERLGLLCGAAAVAGVATEPPAGAPRALPAVEVAPDHVLVTTIKPSDYDERAILVRVLECEGKPADVTLRLPFAAAEAESVDLLERNGRPVRCEGATLHVALRPYEFQTLRIRLA